jgi:hypothetical protein
MLLLDLRSAQMSIACGRAATVHHILLSLVVTIPVLRKKHLVIKLVCPYLDRAVNMLNMTSGGAAPGAALTSQKRSPHPLTTGR